MINVKTKYYLTYKHADRCCNGLLHDYPNARIVEYIKGFAVQYYLSGPYYPHFNMPGNNPLNDRYNPATQRIEK